jgi:type I restriction enzyme M protein
MSSGAYLYESIIRYFMSQLDRKEQSFYTPPEICELLCRMVEPGDGESIYDPACGVGGLLIQSGKFIQKHSSANAKYNIYGQDIDETIFALATMNLVLHSEKSFIVKLGDTIRDPLFLEGEGKIKQFDVIVSNPPLIKQEWGCEFAENDPFNRFHFGVPPKNRGDYAFILHMIESLNPGKGRLATVAPQGVLSRRGSEWGIRKRIIDENLLDAVIALPDKIFHDLVISTVILVFKKQRSDRSVLFIDASDFCEKGKKVNILKPEMVDSIVHIFSGRKQKSNHSSLVDLSEIVENDYNLNLAIYLPTRELEETMDLDAVRQERAELKQEADRIETELEQNLQRLCGEDHG